MIYTTVNMTIGDYVSVCDKTIVLYRGDKNVEIRFVMHGNKFIVVDDTYAQLIIKRPSAPSIFSEPALVQNDTVILTITEEMIDELKELGAYTFQIVLYDEYMTARATLPPCHSVLIIEKPIAIDGESVVNLAEVNDSIVMLADTTTPEEDIFTEDNKYNRTIWKDGDLITDARLNKIEDALYYINENGGNGGATAPYISTELSENVMVGVGANFDLYLDFNSPNMGKGTLKVFVNDVDSLSTKIDQGETVTVIPGDLFIKGTNQVVIYVLDRVGVMSNSLTFYVRYGSTELVSTFDAYSAYDYGSTIRYYFTPTAVDTSLTLTFYMSIDGQVQQGVACTSDTRGYYTFPTNLSADSHYCEAYIIDSNGTKSNVLKFNLIILNTNTLVVASDTKEVTIEEGGQLSLDYKVYMKNNTSFITKVYVDNNLVNTGTCNADFNYYRTSSLTEGTHTVKLEVLDVTETYSDYITWTVTVTPSTYEMLQPVNAGAMFIGTAVNKSNSDERKQYFIGHDQEGNEVLGTLTNFAFNSESGWVNDELIISGNSHVEIPIQPLANNAKYGFTLDIEFTSKQIGVADAEVLTLWNDETNCGVKITTEKLILQSSNGNKCDLYFTDNERTHVMFIIDRQELKAKIYLNGVMCEAFHLNDYTVDGVAYLDDFTVNSNIVLGGLNKNGYCKIRNLRVYQVALTTDEIINNFISCEIDKTKQRELVEFQKGNDLPTLYVYCDFSGLGKDDKKPCKIVYQSTNEELYGKSFNLDHKQSQLQYQGTSSMAYPIKNYRLNLRDENGDKWYYTLPGAQGECRFTLKADFMSSGHWTNTGMAKFINDNLYNYDSNNEKSMNPFRWYHVQNGEDVSNYRETINGFPCRLILVNDGETPLNEGQNEPTPGNTKDMGIFNFNNDKDNVTTLGFNSDIFPNCASYEVTANSDTSAGAFMSYSGDGDSADELAYLKESFELRHPDADDVAEDWGFMEIETEVNMWYIDAIANYGNPITMLMPLDYFNTKSIKIETADNNAVNVREVDASNASTTQYNIRSGTIYTFKDTTVSFSLTLGQNTYIKLNDIMYHVGETFNSISGFREPYKQVTIQKEEGTGLKALIDWVDNCTDEEFVADFEEHFHKDYTLRYFCLVTLIGAVDNLGKNMMLDTADNKIFFPRFYDIDTICSYDNSGQLKFDVDIEMEQGYWNTSSSRLWTRIRDLMHDDIVTTYNDMRQNGVSYENMMKYIYDEQIAKIPQTYYNKDYDIKYAPFADSYIGMAHGDTYEHVKRWLKQRFTFVDTLFDYAPSYNNDVLTIRANTTELMTLEIETYTPVYQHLSWYNGQMDKKKIDGKISVEFSGTAQAATDQEVLIYGGSNVKSIKGITSMNPNRMLIGSATKLVEIDAHDCPLLADINANKANLSPHEYLNKVNLSNCPLLEGNLRLNNSPLVQEINIKGTKITGMNLPSSIRNLEVLRLPNTITELTLNDAGMLHTLDFDEGVTLQSVSMTNCNALENVINFNLLQTPSITLNNSYNNVAELYFRDTTNLSLSNMSNLERVIFTPNNEYETFELINVANAPDYTVTTFNCPKLSTFMTTAPYRDSYNNCGMVDKEVITNVELLDGNYTIGGHWDDSGTYTNSGARNEIVFIENTDIIYHLTVSEPSVNSYIFRVNYFNGDTFISRQYYTINTNTTWDVDLSVPSDCNKIILAHGSTTNTAKVSLSCNKIELFPIKDYGDIQPNTTFTANSIDISNTQFTDVKLLCTTDTNTLKLPTTVKNFYCDSSFDLDTDYLEDGEYDVVHGELVEPYTTDYEGEVLLNGEVPNVIPSSADGSLIFSMYAPSNAVAPASGTWDLYGLEFDNFHTFGMNNDVKPSDDSFVNKVDSSKLAYLYGQKPETDAQSINGGYTDKHAATTKRVLGWFRLPFELNTNNHADIKIVTSDSSNYTLCWWHEDNSKMATPGYSYSSGSVISQDVGTTCLANGYIDCYLELSETVEWVIIQDKYFIQINEVPTYGRESINTTGAIHSFSDVVELIELDSNSHKILNSLTSISMPARYDDYNIAIKNAYIAPKTHNTMLYPLLVNEDNPITGTLDYTNYAGKHLSWSFAYTDEEYVNITQPKDELLNSYEYKYNAFYDTEYEFDNPNEIARYTSSATGLLPLFNTEFTGYTTDETDNGDGTYTVSIATDSLDNLPTLISFTADTNLLTVDKLNTSKVTTMFQMFRSCGNLTAINCRLDTSSVTNEISQIFIGCSKLEYVDVTNLVGSNIKYISSLFSNCISLKQIDGLNTWDTSNVTTMEAIFQGCNNLTSLDVSGFNTSNVTNMNNMFHRCTKLTSLDSMSNISTNLDLSSTILDATSLLDVINNLTTVMTTKSLTLGSTLLAKLTEDQIAIATNKGWTVA